MVPELVGAEVFEWPVVPGVVDHAVRVEIGPVSRSLGGRVYPDYRVLVDGVVVDWHAGDPAVDWSVEAGDRRDGVDAALGLLLWATVHEVAACRASVSWWAAQRVARRRALRETLRCTA